MKREEYVSRWQRIVDEQAASGMTISGWCKANHIYVSYFYKCRRRLRERQEQCGGFIELRSSGSLLGPGVRIVFGYGVYVEVEKGFDPEVLRAVVGSLGSPQRSC